ncbi:zinc ribbon domain-containing protein [Aeromicrobium sp.]|uniref:zinc ribbon domain-containing protein n=1 Tax=Aeromicrobium sp. TaxID=1871063 RepID=UPI003D6BAB80
MDPCGHPEHEEHPLKAEPSAQLTLLDLQAKDSALAQLDHRRTSLPEHARIAELEKQSEELDGQRIEADTAVSDLTRAQAKADAEVEQVKARRARDEDRLSSGAITNPKDLASLQHELGALERRISTLEDDELEVMEQLEEAQNRLNSVTADLDAVKVDLEHVTTARDSAIEAIDAQAATAANEREEVLAQVPEDLLSLYSKVREQYGGLAAAVLRARRCEGCRLELNGADLREIAAKPDDEVLRCPECSRILVRTAESGL